MVRTKKNCRLTREEWLAQALPVIASKGNTKLRIHELVKHLGVTRGSFYWHFEDRDDFVRALVDYYHRWSTDQVIDEVERVGGNAAQRLKTVMQFVAEKDLGRYEVAMTSWGVQEPFVTKSFEIAIRRRIEFARSLFVQLGFEGQKLETRTLAFVGYMSMIHSGADPEVRREHLKHLDERHAVLTGLEGVRA
jgi:AcrR family transcriptional regulator